MGDENAPGHQVRETGGLSISAVEGEGPEEEGRGMEGTEKSRRKALCLCGGVDG